MTVTVGDAGPLSQGGHAKRLQAGVRSHEIALKAKSHLNEAAVLFEQGRASWYASNGWMYPIEGSEGSSKGAVQQFSRPWASPSAPPGDHTGRW
jgi:hypothetical protein